MGGMAGDEPVAITQFFAEYVFLFNRMVCSSENVGLPNSTFAPKEQNLSSEKGNP